MPPAAADYLATVRRLIDEMDLSTLEEMARLIEDVDVGGGTIWVLGNGGSQALASHLVLHLVQCGFRAHDLLSETALLAAYSNDRSYASYPLLRLRQNGTGLDCLLVISGSGDSANVLTALAEARRQGMATLGLLGFGDGGAAAALCGCALMVDSQEHAVIEDVHSVAMHLLSAALTVGGLTPKNTVV